MYSLIKPNRTVKEFFDICVDAKRDNELKTRLQNSKQVIIQAEEEFERKVKLAQLHTIPTHTTVAQVTKNEMKKLYSEKLVSKSSPGRLLYDELMNAPAHGRCPLCGHGTVSTLDHHLPKSMYPSLAITPINLVPACRDCNTTKLEDLPTSANEETIHPYFDSIENERWLYAQVKETAQAPIHFYVDTPECWDITLSNRVKNHFESFQLNQLYTIQAARELVTRKWSIKQAFTSGGVEGVKNVLNDNFCSHKFVNLNSWQTAMYEALLKSEWYCSVGFKF
ncbi:hypothetical protein COD70_26255 [Bacillus cereus]|nr:hypothetical protein COD70_26255 [Bacillus cereus]